MKKPRLKVNHQRNQQKVSQLLRMPHQKPNLQKKKPKMNHLKQRLLNQPFKHLQVNHQLVQPKLKSKPLNWMQPILHIHQENQFQILQLIQPIMIAQTTMPTQSTEAIA